MLKSNDKPAFSKIIINAIILKSLDIFIISGPSNPNAFKPIPIISIPSRAGILIFSNKNPMITPANKNYCNT